MGDTKDAEHQDKVCKHYDVGWKERMPSSSLTTGYFHQKRGVLKRKRRASKSRVEPRGRKHLERGNQAQPGWYQPEVSESTPH